LIELNIADNTFINFTPSDVLSLQVFNCDNNTIVELDFQQNQLLTSISCESNVLETLNIRNGQNTILTNFSALNNTELTCIETDDGSVPSGATWVIDATAQFSVNCFFGETYVPDDNFEQALIDLGYDSGPLDDYVFTEQIEDVSFLNINALEISDLTGIEDFVSLTNLDFEENMVSYVDLSDNIMLIVLDVSGNTLSDLNLTLNTSLVDLDVSNNSLIELNLDSNLELQDIDVSNNLLMNLNVTELVNLEDLNCASNQLSSLNVTQNPNLSLLFCQSNLFIADQLNLQNGNNENLLIFNATSNDDLRCILVDDPFAVSSNVDGTYDNWLKDNSASYQFICEDADNDGVSNTDDLCPNTEFGASVDLSGCAYVDLPNDNFTILITSETCLNSNNGKIRITAQELYAYNVTLVSDIFNQSYNFTNDIDILNLLAGTYEMCITIEEWPDYLSCYTITITEPDPLEVFASRLPAENKIALDMSGSSSYNIEINDEAFTTHNSEIILDLKKGINTLKVSTDIECQGVYEERLFISDDFLLYPNPFSHLINIYDGREGEVVSVNMYSSYGQLVITKKIINQGEAMNIDTSELSAGIYLINIQSKTTTSVYKIIKE
jgi:hypothetical protein